MFDKDQIFLENIYNKILLETRNSSFVRELDSLLQKWHNLQSSIKGTIPTFKYNPDGEPYDAPDAGQKIQKKDLPVYYQTQKDDIMNNTEHPNLRRVYFKQTDAEVELEKELLRIFQKYADQNYFNNDVMFIHDMGYHAHASSGKDSLSIKEVEESYFKNENKVHKNVLSCYGRDVTRVDLRNIGNYGMIVKGHVIYASVSDLASQTTRTASSFIRNFFKHSGIPKRASIPNVHSFEEDNFSLKMKQKIRTRKGLEPMSEEEINDFRDSTVLAKNDSPIIGEALLGNWKIKNWFFSQFETRNNNTYPFPREFWKMAYENNIQKPVYYFELNTDNKPVEINLSDYYS